MIQTLQGLLFIRSLTEVTQEEIKSKRVYLPPPDNPSKKKVIVFDLDETLVHWLEDFEPSEVDHVLTIQFPNNEVVDAGLNIRPYAIEWLQQANKHFQVIVFTASHQWYANAVLDFIDPDHKLIQYRMYRDQCVETPQGIFIKDLRMIANRDLKDILLVDNASYSFGYQLDNGIPIIPFYNDKNDKELLHLIQYLNWVIDSEDVREQNRKAFQLGELSEQEITEYLNLYANEEDGDEGEGESEEEIENEIPDIMIHNQEQPNYGYQKGYQEYNNEYFGY
jgi:CTD small phosphatase-like protein 2